MKAVDFLGYPLGLLALLIEGIGLDLPCSGGGGDRAGGSREGPGSHSFGCREYRCRYPERGGEHRSDRRAEVGIGEIGDEVFNVGKVGTTEAVYGLVGIRRDGQIAVGGIESLQQVHLGTGGVLVLVNEQKAILGTDGPPDVVLIEDLDCSSEQRSAEEVYAEQKQIVDLAGQEALENGVTSFQDAGSPYATIDFLKSLKLADLVNSLKQEHRKLDELWQAIEPELRRMPEPADPEAFIAAATAFCKLNREHVIRENTDFLPIAQSSLSSQQIRDIGRAMAQRRGVRYPSS